MGDQFCDRKNCSEAIDPWPFWHEPIGRAQKNPPTPPFSVLLSTMANRPGLGPDQVALEALAVGTQEELCRPCVDCGLYTGCYCDGNDWGDCFAADRLPRERWANNQRTPLCTACDRRFGMCHFCRGQLWACPPAHRDPARYAPDAGAVPSRNYDQPIFYLAEEGAQPFQGRTTAAPRHVDLTAEDDPRGYDDMLFWEATQRAGGRAAPKFGRSWHPKAKPPPTPAQIAAYNSNNVVARPAGYSAGSGRPKAKAAPDAAFRAAEQDLVRLLGAAPLDDDPIEDPPREEIPLRISPNFARGEYHSFDLFDRIDVAVVGDANAHTR